ncbi:hypothetical protein LOTGIDRAFT_174685 [Lottia gigantea]|uniref:Uncharacterized protein n=1 Tax=Lottia gigantea TaxID=225164 RepID=V4APR3_LOTGI|nr:hypothetical protein LOTGIDRAFT_174685 [Lottia gigantea]ESO96780.1 hypothetical protein LOTGIDRAFT_174685 [Lottia gigantea]
MSVKIFKSCYTHVFKTPFNREGKRNEGEGQEMKNGQSNQTVEEKEYGVPGFKSTATGVKLSSLHHPLPVLTHKLPVKPLHGVLTTIITSNKKSTSLPSRNDDPIKHRRGNNFNQLLQKFSSSEISSSERSESDASSRVTGRSRQSKHSGSISSSDESNTDRQTPERSHSFKLRTVKENDDSPNVPKRSSSFKSDFMRQRYEVDKPPEEEFVSVLQSRSEITDKSDLISLSKYENLDKVKTVISPVEEIIVDKELSAVLKSRRKETDEKVEKDQNSNNSSTHISKPYQDAFISDSLLQSKSRVYNIDSSLAELSKVTEELDKPESTISKTYLSDTEFGQITSQRRKSSSASLSDAVQYIKDVESSISSRISETISKHQDEKKNSRETSPLDGVSKNFDQNKTVQHSSQIIASQKQDVKDRQISSDSNRAASLESKTVVPRGIEIVDEKPKSFALSETLQIKNVTLEESSTDDLFENVSTEMLSSAQDKMADKSMSGVSITPAIIIDKQSISNSRENDAKLHDINKSKMSATVRRDSAETETRRVVVLEEKTQIYSSKIKNEEDSSQSWLIKSDNLSLDAAVKKVDEVHSQQFGDSAKNSSLVTNTLPSDSESVASETKYPLQKDSLPLPSEKYLDVSESTILTSSDRSRDISDNSADDHVKCKPKSTGLSRSESLKTTGLKRTESFERRRGILKRTPSLPKQSGPIIDEQLARILQQRKKQVETEDSPEEEKPGSRRLSVTDEIAEIMK